MNDQPTLLIPCNYSTSADRAVLEYVRDRMDRVEAMRVIGALSIHNREESLTLLGQLVAGLLEPFETARFDRDGGWTVTRTET